MVVEATVESISCEAPQRPPHAQLLVEIPVPPDRGSCPVGAVGLHHELDRRVDVLLPDLLRSDARARKDSIGALADFASKHGQGPADAYVVSCTPLRWAFVQSGSMSTEPRWEGWTYVPPPPPDDDAHASAIDATEVSAPTTPPAQPSAAICEAPPLPPKSARWIGRSLSTGAMPGPSTLTTFILDRTPARDGEQIRLVTFTQRSARPPGPPREVPPTAPWTCHESRVTTGTLRASRGGLALELPVAGQPDEPDRWTCRLRDVKVATANGLREALPQIDESCKRSRWVTPRTSRRVLSCTAEFLPQLVFAPAPGVEAVTIDGDDCGDRTEALRAIGKDNAIRVVRKFRDSDR